MFRRSGRSYGNATQTIANDPDDSDDLDRFDRVEFYPDDRDDHVNFEAIMQRLTKLVEFMWLDRVFSGSVPLKVFYKFD